MLINVPQYIDVEDKIAGPLTLKQLGWMMALGIIGLVMWNTMPLPVFIVLGIPVALFFVALAFYRPYGQPLGNFIYFGILYFFRPKVYTWKRYSEREISIPKTVKVENSQFQKKELTPEKLRGLANLLDSEGTEHDLEAEGVINKRSNANRKRFF